MLGLFVGKQIGVFGFAYVAIKTGLAELPSKASILQLYGISLLVGIGFTMSLFIGALAYVDPEHPTSVRIGVISGMAGTIVLLVAGRIAARSAEG